jgi:hypothetical protein
MLINADTKLINKIKPKAIKFKIKKFSLIKRFEQQSEDRKTIK